MCFSVTPSRFIQHFDGFKPIFSLVCKQPCYGDYIIFLIILFIIQLFINTTSQIKYV